MAASELAHVPRAQVIGIQFDVYNKEQLLLALSERALQRQRTLVLSGNVHSFNMAYEQVWLRELFASADYLRIDGVGLRLGGRILGQALPPRMTWADFIWDLSALAAARQLTLFFLGGRPGVAAQAAEKLWERFPTLQIVGLRHGYFEKATNHPENTAILADIAATRPHFLIIGFGMPLQERWISENWSQLEATVTMTAGAVFDYTAGELRRAPRWVTNSGFEWLGRLAIEPRRLWRRYLLGNPRFLWRVLRQRVGYGHPGTEGTKTS